MKCPYCGDAVMKNDEMPLISVIVPVYNNEMYLEKCLESICRQTYTNLEIIVVNDGSTDSSRRIIDKWEKMDDRIVAIHQDNMGVSAARNAGLNQAKGEYIGFVDSDDYIHENMYSELYQLLKQNDCPMAMCSYSVVDINGNKVKQIYDDPASQIYSAETFLNAMLENVRFKHMLVCPWSKLCERRLFDHIRYPHGKIYEDNFVIHRLVYEAQRIAFINKQLYFYCKSDNSIMRTDFTIKRLYDFEAQIDRIAFLESKQADSDLINRFGCECIQSGISYWLQMKYYKCASKDKNREYYESVKSVVKKFIAVCSVSNKLKGMLFLYIPEVLFCGYWIKRKIVR